MDDNFTFTTPMVPHGFTPPEKLNLLSPDIFKICTDMVFQIILSGYTIEGYLASGYLPWFIVPNPFWCIQGIYQN